MGKFYTIEEAASKLGKSPADVKAMVEAGKLQQFRDVGKVVVKADDVEALAGGKPDSGAPIQIKSSEDSDAIQITDELSTSPGGDTDIMSKTSADTDVMAATRAGDKTDAIKLSPEPTKKPGKGEKKQATGVSVFDAGEVEAADPSAQTVITGATSDEELALESVGSGSGLLDLTRESDDTSLGAELLDEIYPGGESSDSKIETAAGSSGVMEASGTSLAGTSAAGTSAGTSAVGTSALGSAVTDAVRQEADQPLGVGGQTVVEIPVEVGEVSDPAWSGFSIGSLLFAAVALVMVMIVCISSITGVISGLTTSIAQSPTTVVLYPVVLLVLAVIGGLVGLFLGKSMAK